MRYRILEEIDGRRSFALVLDAGEEVVAAVTHFATVLGVKSGSFTGIGALSHAELGWFNPATKEFRANVVDEQVEVLSITGNIAEADDGDGHDHGHADDGGIHLHIHIAPGLWRCDGARRAFGLGYRVANHGTDH